MKKLTLLAAAALCAAPLVATANPVLYGRVNINLVNEDVDGGDSTWDLENNSSRLGVKGSEDLGNGLSAIYQFEFNVDAADSGALDKGRLSYVGLSGGFGTFAVGRQWTPYYNTVDKTDVFQVNGMNETYLGPSRVGNAVAYVTPDFSGFSAAAALIVDGDGSGEDNGEDVDYTNVSLDYAAGPLSVGFSWLRDSAAESDLYGLGAKYNFGSFALIGQYENDNDADVSAWALVAEAYFGNNTLRALYGTIDTDVEDYDHWVLGAEHKLSKRTRLFVEYEDSDGSASSAEHQRFGVGLRHDF